MMQEEEITLRPKKLKSSLYKLHLKENISNNDFYNFKQNLEKLISETKTGESNNQTEEYFKNLLKTFLEKTYYENKNFLNTMSYKGQNEADLVIHSNKDQNSKVGVIFEIKKPKNKGEMLIYKDIFKKAFFEAILYFLWESVDKQNFEVKNIVISNIYEYFIFDARDIKRVFLDKSKVLENTFKKWRTNQLTDEKTDTMYKEIENYVNTHLKFFDNLRFTYFDIREIQEDDFMYLYKILSPKHLLREVLTNDSNSLNKDFYNELLHIIGLEEVEKDNKKVIQRKEKPDSASLLENAINIIDSKDKLDNVSNLSSFGSNNKEKIYNVSLSLCIRWINRILFLKLLEGQLYKYHGFDSSYKFLDSDKINSFDKLNNLFFSVLAKKTEDRKANIQNDYFRIPYLNSSLFEMSILENEAIDISQLENNLEMSSYKSSVLKDNRGKKLKESLPNLKYLLDFLNSFDFGSEGENKLNNEIKPLINASVLGLIFEKINGYKDGSFYTPGFITTYMCRESIQKAVIQKFNDKYSWNCETTTELYNKIDRIDVKEANEIFNSLKICDPAVGSGHFLVSSLNEIIALKSELGIFCDNEGKKLRGYNIENFNDELVITDEDDNIFEYSISEHTDLQPVTRKIAREKTRIQKALFFEKKHIIENSLFGVDINNNSVMICRLRLWIELLKNSFYTEESNFIELETLPNIDINIKQGNSLISRYDLDVNLKTVFNKKGFSVKEYRDKVRDYKETNDKSFKKDILKYIEDIKTQFKSEVAKGFLTRIQSSENELKQMDSTLFGVDKETKNKIEEKQKKLDEMLEQKEEIENSVIYKEAFEWRFEFPEVLDEKGDFIGFDVVLGNPPWGAKMEPIYLKHIKNNNNDIVVRILDTFMFFINKSTIILKKSGVSSLIVPDVFLYQDDNIKLRLKILDNYFLHNVINLGDKIFENVTRASCIISFSKNKTDNIIIGNLSKNAHKSLKIDKNILNKLNQEIYKKLPNNIFATDNLQGYNILSKIYYKFPTKLIDFIDKNEIQRGVSPDLKEAFIINDEIIIQYKLEENFIKNTVTGGKDVKKYIITNFTKRLIYTDRKDNITNFPNIIQYLSNFKDKITCKEVKELKHDFFVLHRARDKEIFDKNEKLIGVITGDKIIVAIDYNKIYPTDGCYLMSSNQKCSNKFLLSVLNSSFITYLYRLLSLEINRTLAQVKPTKLNEIPIPEISIEKQKPFVDLVDEILEKKKQNIDTIDLENKIDQMVYKLYELTEEEIAIIECY